VRIYRFLDERGNICWGQDYDGKTACLIRREPVDAAEDFGAHIPVNRFLVPQSPSVIFGIGLNYRAHAEETGKAVPEEPMVFMKNLNTALGHQGTILLPPETVTRPEVDYECELAVVLAKAAKNVSEEEALDYVMGYTIANDVSARIWQKHRSGGQFVRGKSFDTFCPMGPCLVTPDAIPDPQNLYLKTWVNGELLQDGHTSDMIFSVRQLISQLSHCMTLLPGTIILTGTPSGVGAARDPRAFLKPGAGAGMELEGIGKLVNDVAEASVPARS